MHVCVYVYRMHIYKHLCVCVCAIALRLMHSPTICIYVCERYILNELFAHLFAQNAAANSKLNK